MEILTALAAGGDAATIGILYVLWQNDRRLFCIEEFLKLKFNFKQEKQS